MKLFILLMVLFISSLIVGVTLEAHSETEEVKKECYDEYHNEIEGLSCIEERWINRDLQLLSIILISVGSLGLFLTIILKPGVETKNE